MTFPAVRLFVQAARRVQHDFRLVRSDVPAVVRICELVDGRPLALEIAASWLRIYDCADIQREIERSFEFLATELRDVPARHRSVRTVFNHTWELLSACSATGPGRSGGVSRPVQAGGGPGSSRHDNRGHGGAAGCLAGAAQSQRLVRDTRVAAPVCGAADYHGESADQASRRHSDHYLNYLAAREADLVGPEPHDAVAQIRRRLDNIRLAWQRASEQGWLAEPCAEPGRSSRSSTI